MSDPTLRPRSSTTLNRLLSAAFIVFICAPVLVLLLRPSTDVLSSEMRQMASRPAIGSTPAEWATFPARFEDFFNDRFGLRNRMVLINSYIMTNVLRTSPVPKVIIGKEDWLYYAPTPTLEAYRGLAPFSEDSLERWRTQLEQRSGWFADRGIKYLFVVAPSKKSIYPQHLPKNFDGVFAQTPLDQLLAYMKEKSDFSILDLRTELRAASALEKTYLHTDTHWNHIGAHVGYRRIVEETQQWFPKETWQALETFPVEPSYQAQGDLARMLGLQEAVIEQQVRPSAKCGHLVDPGFGEFLHYKMSYKYGSGVQRSKCADKSLRVVVFRDSFLTAALPYFSDQYGEVIYVWYRYDHQLMEKILETFTPDLVIEERTERDI